VCSVADSSRALRSPAMTDDKDELIRQLAQRLRETVDENDRLKALVANLTEGATAHQTLQSLYRRVDLPESLRAKCAIGALPHETRRLDSVPPPLDLKAEAPPEPLADVIARQRARCDRMLAERRQIKVLPSGQVIELGGNGSGQDDDTGG